ncbi:MAG: type I glyceraldehyde-3-phosphate dehydrogenase [Parcubacteria group bacterium CG1_02_37_51]|uniref:Type I glyceraldehyde-3-phosphate dehydrogenase n=2 Tax=Candidatus Komeiliibacteriota TaxID=1817908 RepID=A0A2M8DSA6_9BACT|nr:MAG: type I glyceraldehyde-3-phosphate dehydrogenase [Parcubacteria group bacterium CG1_02_37_51]PIY94914.1 MAG: type I glyceraldehyde-3-phosphate dehydrogenase [Candidatus Komeilibacteria bacterium CG_4_10_14_0_8_um_filter_37_78]PJC02267.1 MAG: type I glyceraldehyde-3-phosphate dehydrogenase [Candidatus Komeilibacteria bacterium CG_4_9_14_0_8_um_filter_36_9]
MTNKIRVAINGFGRIGRAAFRIAVENPNIEIVAINDLAETKILAHLLKFDSIYGPAQKLVEAKGKFIYYNKKRYQTLAEMTPEKLPWKKMKVDIVLECTGRFRTKALASKHLKAGATKVIISAPAKGQGVGTYIMGVNDQNYKSQKVINNASCTTNCVAPVAQVIHSAFGVKKAMMTTIHSYTADQRLQDAPHDDLRRTRAAAQNIIPTTTGAATATAEAIPELQGLFDGLALRVPTICGSLADFTFLVNKKVTVKQVNDVLRKASDSSRYNKILEVTEESIVSSDIIGNCASSIVDLQLTQVVGGDLVKVIAWYDNEWGYANRLVEMVEVIS